jgi:hypothetical protein
MFQKLENYILGPNSQQIKMAILTNPKEVIDIDFGPLLGQVYFIKPSENIPIAELLNHLDKQPDARKSMAAVDYVLGGPSLLASTDTHRQKFHGIFKRSLSRPVDYMGFMLDALKTYLPLKEQFNLKQMVAAPIRQAITQGLFNLNQPNIEFEQALEALSVANMDMEKDVSTEIRQTLVGIHYPYLLNTALSWLAYDAKKKYSDNIQKFIQNQADLILNDLYSYAENKSITNVISLSIIELIKEENQLWRESREELNLHLKKMEKVHLQVYLENKFINTLPGMMVASDSIMAIVTGALNALAKNEKLLNKLRIEIQNERLDPAQDIFELKNNLDQNKNTGGLLHRVYLEALRLRSLEESVQDKPFSSGVVWRYTNKNLKLNQQLIPAGSAIAILTTFYFYDENHWPNPGNFKPSRYEHKDPKTFKKTLALSIHGVFSQGNGACPASVISEYLFKTFIIHMVTNYDFAINLTHEQNRTNYTISLKPREDILMANKMNIV